MSDWATIAGSAVIAAFISGFVAWSTNARNVQIENVTKERVPWRDKIRSLTREVCHARGAGVCDRNNKLDELRAAFAVNLNPFDDDDNEILAAVKKLKTDRSDAELEKFCLRVALLLKHDWERAKYEAKPLGIRLFLRLQDRVKLEDMELNKQSPWPKFWEKNECRVALAATAAVFWHYAPLVADNIAQKSGNLAGWLIIGFNGLLHIVSAALFVFFSMAVFMSLIRSCVVYRQIHK